MTPLEREELDAADDIVNKIIGAPSGIVPWTDPDGLVKRAFYKR